MCFNSPAPTLCRQHPRQGTGLAPLFYLLALPYFSRGLLKLMGERGIIRTNVVKCCMYVLNFIPGENFRSQLYQWT